MRAKTGPFSFAEFQTVTSLGRGEIRECINRGIISAPAAVGQGHHRVYSKWNLVEGVIAAALLRHVRAGSVAVAMTRLRLMLAYSQIDLEASCNAPEGFAFFDFILNFPPRTRPDKTDPPFGEDIGESDFVTSTARAIGPLVPQRTTRKAPDERRLAPGNPLEAFCALPIDLEQAVRFVDHMIETKL
jgi:hypothetical protein